MWVKFPSPAPGFAPLAQMRYARLPYKQKVPSSQLGRGTRFGRVVITGGHWSCKPRVGIRLPPRPPSGHGLVAEFDIASVEARVRFPLTAPRGVGIWGVPRPSKPKKRIRFPHAAPVSGCGLVFKAPGLGPGDRRSKSCRPDQIDGGW